MSMSVPAYLGLVYNVSFLGLSWTPLPTLMWDVINECSPGAIGTFEDKIFETSYKIYLYIKSFGGKLQLGLDALGNKKILNGI